VYAAACLAYEALTTQPLFDQPTEVALTAAHVSHDGWPTPLRSWHRQKDLAPVAELVGRALRRNPRDRIDVSTFRMKLASLAPSLALLPWPLSP
jgi:serine/threonine protein kinase